MLAVGTMHLVQDTLKICRRAKRALGVVVQALHGSVFVAEGKHHNQFGCCAHTRTGSADLTLHAECIPRASFGAVFWDIFSGFGHQLVGTRPAR
jgi:hypothetical protein